MRVRIVHNYFHPDPSAVSQVITDLAVHLAGQGHEVSVLASSNRYAPGSEAALPRRASYRGVSVRRTWSPSFGRHSAPGRILNQLAFIVGASIASITAPRVDTVVFLTEPPLMAVLGLLLKRLRGERFVYVIMDLYPDVAIRHGLFREGSLLSRALRWITRRTLRGADQVVVLGECMREVVAGYGITGDSAVVIHNWADPELVAQSAATGSRFRAEHGLGDRFVVMYSGNLGIAHRFDDLLEVARRLQHNPDIAFVLIGDGARGKEVEEFIELHRPTNLYWFPFQPKDSLGESLRAADVHFVTLRSGFEGMIVPSKTYGIMACGRPIIYQGAATGEVARIVRDHEVGAVVDEGDVAGLEAAILKLYNERGRTAELGEHARNVLLTSYSREDALARYETALRGEDR
jgi:colanic acid biosynthesis glycosyl transferase WcaI